MIRVKLNYIHIFNLKFRLQNIHQQQSFMHNLSYTLIFFSKWKFFKLNCITLSQKIHLIIKIIYFCSNFSFVVPFETFGSLIISSTILFLVCIIETNISLVFSLAKSRLVEKFLSCLNTFSKSI